MEQNQQSGGQGRGRRGQFHRGRRPDRRPQGGVEQRASQQGQEPQTSRSEHVDVEQIMRDIRARIAHRHGIDLSTQQVSELAARRLEAILDPRNINPTLLEQLRKAAGARPVREAGSAGPEPSYTFEDSTIYDTHRGLLRAIRKLLNPILRLFFNPNTIVHALNTQARLNADQAAREAARAQEQAEWNALHYELLKRMVTEAARLSIELQALTLKVESLATRVDFTDRRVRSLEAAPSPQRHGHRPAQESHTPSPSPATASALAPLATSDSHGSAPAVASVGQEGGSSADGQRKRRRRRRGRRSAGTFGDGGQLPGGQFAAQGTEQEDGDDQGDDSPENGDGQQADRQISGGSQRPAMGASDGQLEFTAAAQDHAPATETPASARPDEPGSPGSES